MAEGSGVCEFCGRADGSHAFPHAMASCVPWSGLRQREREDALQLFIQLASLWPNRHVAEQILRDEIESGRNNLEGSGVELTKAYGEVKELVESVWGKREREGERERLRLGCACRLTTEHLHSLLRIGEGLRGIVSLLNRRHRLRIEHGTPTRMHSRDAMAAMERRYSPRLLPPPTPAEYIHDGYLWFKWGEFDRQEEFIGHGWVWRHRPLGSEEALTNMASNALTDYDVVEEGFVRLKRAKVIVADYDLLRSDFPHLLKRLTDDEIDTWLLDNAAFISAGQV
jgi:hypothetical protein